MRRHVFARADQPLLFTGPQADPHRAAQLDAGRLEDAHRLEHRRRARGVVGRAGRRVPRVEVRAEHHEFVRLVGAGDFADDVEHRRVVGEGVLDVGLDRHRHVLGQQARHPAVLLCRDHHRGQRLGRIGRAVAADRVDAVAARRRRQRAERALR